MIQLKCFHETKIPGQIYKTKIPGQIYKTKIPGQIYNIFLLCILSNALYKLRIKNIAYIQQKIDYFAMM